MGIGVAAIVAATAGVVSAGVAGYSAYSQTKQAQAQAEQDATTAEYNARLEDFETKEEEKANLQRDKRLSQEHAEFKAQQNALFGLSGAMMDSSTINTLQKDTLLKQRQESNDLLKEGATALERKRNQATAYRYQAKVFNNLKPRSALLNAGLAATGSLAQNIGNNAKTYFGK